MTTMSTRLLGRDRLRPPARQRNGIALGLVLTPVLLLIGMLVLVSFTPLRVANRSIKLDLRATYLQPSGMTPPFADVRPPNGFSMSSLCPHRVEALLRGGPIVYSFHYTHGKAVADSARTSDSFTLSSMVPIASVPQSARVDALVGSALNSERIPAIFSGSRGRYGILVLECDRELASKVLKADAKSNQYDIRF